jgi:GDP-L-galactose phosphorylase
MSSLLVHRVATVLSLAQLPQDDLSSSKPPPVTVSSLPGRSIPTYYYKVKSSGGMATAFKRSYDSLTDSSSSAIHIIPSSHTIDTEEEGSNRRSIEHGSLLDTLVRSMWNDSLKDGLFRYSLDNVETKLVPGKMGWVSQLNEGRAAKKRPTEFTIDEVCQPFDPSKFHFAKAYASEVLFAFELPPFEASSCSSPTVQEVPCPTSPNLVLINVSPIDYGHLLLVPRALDSIPQVADTPSLELAIQFVMEAANPHFRLGYNSLGAYASVNHLHYQGYTLNFKLACEMAQVEPLSSLPSPSGSSLIRVGRLSGYPVNTFVCQSDGDGDWIPSLASIVAKACLVMQEINQPHNLFICEGGRRVFVFPNRFSTMLAENKVPSHLMDTGVNPAVFEMSGHQLFKRRKDYNSMDEALINELLSYSSLPNEEFIQLGIECGLIKDH